MKSDLRLILPVLLVVMLAMGCQQKKGATNDSTAEIDTTAIIEDTIIEINESELLLAKFRNIDFDDTLTSIETSFGFHINYMIDTVVNGNYLRFGIAESTASVDSICRSKFIFKDTNDIFVYPGHLAKIFINPTDKNDGLVIDRDMIHNKLEIANNDMQFDSLKAELGLANICFSKAQQDTIILCIYYGCFAYMNGKYAELKVLKENSKYSLWVKDISDEIELEEDRD